MVPGSTINLVASMVCAAAGKDPGAARSTSLPPSIPTSSRICPCGETTVPLMTATSSIVCPFDLGDGAVLRHPVTRQRRFRHDLVLNRLNKAVLQWLTAGKAHDVSEDIAHLLLAGTTGAAADMGCQDDVLQFGQRTIELQRLEGENIESGRSDGAVAQCHNESFFVDHRSPAGVDKRSGRFHQRQLPSADEAVGLRTMGNMQRDEVRRSQEVVERRGADTEQLLDGRRQWLTLEVKDVHLKGTGAPCDLGTDFAKANQAQGLAAHLLQVWQFHPLKGEDSLAGRCRLQAEISIGASR